MKKTMKETRAKAKQLGLLICSHNGYKGANCYDIWSLARQEHWRMLLDRDDTKELIWKIRRGDKWPIGISL